MTKAIGWLLVGLGGLLLAVKETWELTEHYEWPVAVFWILVVVMAAMSAVYTFAAQGQGQKLLRSMER